MTETKKFILLICFFVVLIGMFRNFNDNRLNNKKQVFKPSEPEPQVSLDSTQIGTSTILSGLVEPWEIAWGPDNCIWFTEHSGTISKVNPLTGEKKLLLKIPGVYRKNTLGLLGMALHPDMKNSPYVFIDYIYMKGADIILKVVRYTYNGDVLYNPLPLLEIPGNIGHVGSRIAIAPDGKLMIATGDADVVPISGKAQKLNSLNGKILRLNTDGSIPSDNPFHDNAVWALGFRVPQGLVYSTSGKLYCAEHGDANDDEVNLIKKGANYGYPNVTGFCDLPDKKKYCNDHNIIEPLQAWTPTIAPAGIDYYNSSSIPEWQNSILLVTLKTQTFRVLKLNSAGTAIESENVYFKNIFGRLRDICISPAGDIYISTSNRDWNPGAGFPKKTDDRIIRIFKIKNISKQANSLPQIKQQTEQPKQILTGALVYTNYCESCHKQNGNGVPGVFPPLIASPQVSGEKSKLLDIILHGLSKPTLVQGVKYNEKMPAFNFLKDEEIAAVLTFIRTSFENNASQVSAPEVSKGRK